MHDVANFLRPFARKTPKEELDDIVEQRQQAQSEETDKKGKKIKNHIEVTPDTFKDQILDNEKAFLVYFTTLAADVDPWTEEYKSFNKLTRSLKGMVNVALMRLDPNDSEFTNIKKKYKVNQLDAGKPKIRFYPNVEHGKFKKLDSSSQIVFNRTVEDVVKINAQVYDLYWEDIESISAGDFNNVIVKYAKD